MGTLAERVALRRRASVALQCPEAGGMTVGEALVILGSAGVRLQREQAAIQAPRPAELASHAVPRRPEDYGDAASRAMQGRRAASVAALGSTRRGRPRFGVADLLDLGTGFAARLRLHRSEPGLAAGAEVTVLRPYLCLCLS